MYHACKEGEELRYIDITSLYPWVNKYCKLPIGHPKVHVREPFPEIATVNGIVKVTVRPPQSLYHPVLPQRIGNKLVFPLCQICAENKNQGECEHTDREREITGTWVADEVQLAMEMGYVIVKIHEIWEYEVVQCDPRTKKGGFFSEYVNEFLKLKQEASGLPFGVESEEEIKKYVDEYYEKEGVKLDSSNIRKNAGLRTIAKLCLNSFWGFFGMNPRKPQAEIIDDPKIFYQLFN